MPTPEEVLLNKPQFELDQPVKVTFNGTDFYRAKVVGLASEHIIDMWIVELWDRVPDWPWRCVVVPHPQIRTVTPPTQTTAPSRMALLLEA